MTPRVLLVTSIYDFSADTIALRLRERRVPFFRLNIEQYQNLAIALSPAPALLSVDGDGTNISIDSSLQSIYFRQAIYLRNSPGQPLSVEEQLVRSQHVALTRSLVVFESAEWMNDPTQTFKAELKTFQLAAADRCGFETPRTLVTNRSAIVEREFTGRLAIKALDTVLLREPSKSLFAYTSLVDRNDLLVDDFNIAPVIVQQALTPKIDIRVTVVGERLWAVKILSQGSPIDGDWRTQRKENLEYVDVELPSTVAAACMNLMDELGLVFGAIDLVEHKGKHFFLEINPTGEWGWLDSASRQISKEICSWLCSSE